MTVKSPNLDIEHLEANSDQPEVPVNVAIDAIDAKITGTVTINIGDTSPHVVTVAQGTQKGGSIFELHSLSPGPSVPFTVQFASFGMGIFSVFNHTPQTATLTYSGQPFAAPTLASLARGLFQGDGTNIVKLL